MKHSSTAIMQFSGYPLTIAEPKKQKVSNVIPIKKKVCYQPTTSIQTSSLTSDPKHWDENWFNGYE
jgi:hypothetical protein